MKRKMALFSLCAALALMGAPCPAQGILPTTPLPLLQPSQTNYLLPPGGGQVEMVINSMGFPPGTSVVGLMALNNTPSGGNPTVGSLPLTPDFLTSLELQLGLNGSLGNASWTMLSTIGVNGQATLSLSGPLPPGLSIYVAVLAVSGSTLTVMPGPSMHVLVPCLIGSAGGSCGGPGGTYRGPGDTVPPNGGPGGGPGGPHSNFCASNPSFCTLTPANDPLGCGGTNTDHVDLPVPQVFVGPVSFGCAVGEGEAGEATLAMLQSALAQAQSAGIQHIDLLFEAAQPLKHLYIYPVQALQQYCLQWLAMGPSSTNCGAIQICNEIVGSSIQIGPFGVPEGFFFGPCDPSGWNRAYGENDACVTDLHCMSGPALTGVRLRLRVDCLSFVINTILTANPGFWNASSVLFSFVGEYCPNLAPIGPVGTPSEN